MKISTAAGFVCVSLLVAGCGGETDASVAASAIATESQPPPDLQGATKRDDAWQRIAPGVYQRTEVDGSTTRMAYGDDGAKYDRAMLEARVRELEAARAGDHPTGDDATELAQAKTALAGIPRAAGGPIVPELSSSGTMLCGVYPYFFDSQLVSGYVGITEVARAYVWSGLWGPAPLPPDSVVEYASATLTTPGAANPTTTQSASTTSYAQAISAVNNTTFGAGNPASCTGSTFSYIQLNGGSCQSSTYVSQRRRYPSCANSP